MGELGGLELGATERQLLTRLVVALEEDSKTRAVRPGWVERWNTPISILVGAATIVASVIFSWLQLDNSADQFERAQRADRMQFERTMRANQYSDIVGGLASPSVGVQVNSLRRLVQYVTTDANFEDDDLQSEAATNTAQTLSAFIEDQSRVSGKAGLADFRDPQPVVVSRALTQLVTLMREGFATVNVDLTRGNFHGVGTGEIVPQGGFYAVAADFRGAHLGGWDLSASPGADLRSSFFTCADLQTANLGTAKVDSADFTGANLRGADLSRVTGLTTAQLRGALVGPMTRLPDGVRVTTRPWGVQDDQDFGASPACRLLMERMTGLLPGSRYSERLPCPGEDASRWRIRLDAAQQAALRRVCGFPGLVTTRATAR